MVIKLECWILGASPFKSFRVLHKNCRCGDTLMVQGLMSYRRYWILISHTLRSERENLDLTILLRRTSWSTENIIFCKQFSANTKKTLTPCNVSGRDVHFSGEVTTMFMSDPLIKLSDVSSSLWQHDLLQIDTSNNFEGVADLISILISSIEISTVQEVNHRRRYRSGDVKYM